ncbi:LANO_0B07162g1_1 [Lachancea nothofagi CBS 11611]|uniref:LANO_0B07162g1_1 n=1 Tax=Lachancea nothofagi CBS 11611 TaxID=1266666 RepID=A0A1G4IZW4_9SACH|nr:LANO_0B07162g1_1 [Lachancea nothofagi CBS 11611]
MAQRPSFLEHASDNNNASQKTRPMLIPRQVSSVHVEGPTSVVEETFSSSHSSESYIPTEEHPLSRHDAYHPERSEESGFKVGSNISQLSGIVGGPSHSNAQRKRPSVQKRTSSYSRGSFVGKNGSFISTSLGDEYGNSTESGSNPVMERVTTTKLRPTNESDKDLAGADAIINDDANNGDNSFTTSDKEMTVSNSVPTVTSQPIKISNAQPMAKTHSSKYFHEFAQEDDFLQQYTPFHNSPTSVSNSYGTNNTLNDMMMKKCQMTEVKPEPNLSEIPELVEIANFPTDRLLNMLTALLDKIVRSNDQLHRDRPPDDELTVNEYDEGTNATSSHSKPQLARTYSMGMGATAEILSFRGKHVPAITLQQYFQRIQKYCPTTNDVFLSLLVYFDRIAKACNDGKDQVFVMDSYNIHRLIISAVTVSTKFFSDFFYSNSRYARVGGISLKELNHLELQFLILCDFELIISVEELQKYGTLLRDFWQREMGDPEGAPGVVL